MPAFSSSLSLLSVDLAVVSPQLYSVCKSWSFPWFFMVESNIFFFFPFAYNCEWKAHIFFVHRSMHWKAVHLWTQVHQTETFFIILLSIPSSSSDVVLWRSQPFFHSKHPKKSRGERGDHHIYLLLYEFQASRETERKCRESLLQREMMQSL